MTVRLKGGWSRRASATLAGVLAAVATAFAVGAGTPAFADDPYDGEYHMWVNDNYDGYGGVALWCLSTNGTTSNSGAGTHFVYLVPCKPSTAAQWWAMKTYIGGGPSPLYWIENYGFQGWELSANNTTPAGGDAGTYGAYTAGINHDTAATHVWGIYPIAGVTNAYQLYNKGTFRDLSASANNPEISGTMRVYTVGENTAQRTHRWRIYTPAGRPSTP